MELKGKVKSLTWGFYQHTIGNPEPYAFSTRTYQFDENGYITTILEDDEETTVIYDSLVMKTEESTWKRGELIRKMLYQDNRLLVMEGTGASGSSKYRIEYEYDETGNSMQESTFDREGQPQSFIKYNYDSLGNVIEKLGYNSRMELNFKNRFRYDAENRKTQLAIYDPESDLVIGGEIYAYNTDGSLASSRGYDENGTLGYPREYTYKIDYDDHGNWLKRVTFINGVRHELYSEREIYYY